MDLLGERPAFSLSDEAWRIYSRHESVGPQYVGTDAQVVNSAVTAGCEILGTVKNSVLGYGVKVGAGAVVEDSVIMAHVTIEDGACVKYSIIDENVTIGKNATVGSDRAMAKEIAVIGADVQIAPEGNVPAGAMISE